MKIRPLHDQVLVRELAPDTRTPSGLFIPEQAQGHGAALVRAEVLNVGEGRRTANGEGLIPCGVKPGDLVAISKFGGNRIELADGDDNGKLYILRDADIFGVFDPE